MGVVYRATHLRLQRVDALKVITPELADELEFRSRFERESRAAANIDHPNVIPIYAAGEEEGLLYIAMRFVEGTDLRAMMRQEGRIEPRRAAEIVMAVAAALDVAHEHGLVHRDVKPANVLLSRQRAIERVYLTDFGLAKAITAPEGETKTGVFLGTTDYVSPEQVMGARLDARSDVYSLGATLFHMLTGRVPYPAEFAPAKLVAHTRDPVPSVLDLAPRLPSEFDAVIGRAMAKLPDERFQSAGDLGRAALAAAEGGAFIDGQRSVAKGQAAPAGTTMVSPVAASDIPDATVLVKARPESTQTAIAASGKEQTRARPQTMVSPGDDSRRGVSRRPLALTGVIALVAAGIAAVAIALTGGSSQPVSGKGVIAVGNSPDGIAIGRGTVWVANAGDGTVTGIDERSGKVLGTISYSNHADMTAAITIGHKTVWVADSADGTVQRIDAVKGQLFGSPIVVGGHPSAITVAAGDIWVANYDRNTVARIDETSGRLIGGPIQVGRDPTRIAASNSGLWVTNAGDGTVSRIDLRSGRVTGTLHVGGNPAAVSLTAGELWVANYDSGTVTRFDPSSGKPVGGPVRVGSAPTRIAAASDNLWVANSADGTVTWLDGPTGRVSGTIRVGGHPQAINVTNGTVWVASWTQPSPQYRGVPGKLTRIEASSGKVLGA
jgi:serine/threonine-protein kinase